jgi:predicted acetyltransferase
VIGLLVNIVRWRVPKEKSNEQFEVWREMMDYQKSHPEKFYYARSRFFTFTEEGSSEENWMFLDEYESREDYEKWMKTVGEDTEIMKLMDDWMPNWNALVVTGSKKKGEVWTEVEKLRVEFK